MNASLYTRGARTLAVVGLALSAQLVLSACSQSEAGAAVQAPAATVTVAPALEREVRNYDDFSGRFEAVEHVDVRPRVSGYIASVRYTEGGDVHKGDLLFVIDPRPYLAQRDGARAGLAQAQARLELARAERERATQLLGQHAISREEYDTRIAGYQQADASLAAARAALDEAELNVGFTAVRAPISGRIGRAQVTAGNLVSADQTLLTTLVAIDPIYVAFDCDEQSLLRYRRAGDSAGQLPVRVGLADEAGFPHEARLVFLDNVLDPGTGTLRARARLANADRHFTPGLFARLRVQSARPHRAVLVNDSAIGTDQTVRFVFVVEDTGKVQYRPVTLGPTQDGLREVAAGLAAGEQVVVNGLQRVRPGATVSVTRVAMGGDIHGPAQGPATPLVARAADKRTATP